MNEELKERIEKLEIAIMEIRKIMRWLANADDVGLKSADIYRLDEENVKLRSLCQVMFDPENSPPQFDVDEAWERYKEIIGDS